ncbi:hypothetical protein CDAR_236121 [Caerostris darwini]|uniref:Uncharacterized protein n=1 Tax=Caerostris darwini TaxID=1538125 RepID=A0AAV4VEH6_9ARAC|nr:hypothetical protein CDAR_236121 [Caerostris darwini]
MHPKQPQFADVANVSPSKCNDEPLLGRSSFLIKDDSSASSSSISWEEMSTGKPIEQRLGTHWPQRLRCGFEEI